MTVPELIDVLNQLDNGEGIPVVLDGWEKFDIDRVDSYKGGRITSKIALTPSIPDPEESRDFDDD